MFCKTCFYELMTQKIQGNGSTTNLDETGNKGCR